MVKSNYIEVRIAARLDAGDLLGLLSPDAESMGAWEEDGIVRLFWLETSWNEDVQHDIERALLKLGVVEGAGVVSTSVVPDEDWNARWAESVQPIRIGRRVVVRQSWNAAAPPPGGFTLVIDPKQAFGSGSHATTQLLVEWLEEAVQGGERVLDVGTGSGILAMAAARLGARAVIGVDNDPVAIDCARENAAINGFGPELDLQVVSLEEFRGELFDLVVANLDRRTILSFPEGLARHLRPEGRLGLSGIQAEDYAEVSACLAGWDLEITGCREREEWQALELRFRQEGR